MVDTGTSPEPSPTGSPPAPPAPPAPPFAAEIEAQRRELGMRLLDLFPALYLTLASIIQGVAFSYLAGTLHDHLDHLTLLIALRALAALVLISALWSLYAFFAFALVWYPTVLDGLIPFAYGVAEVLLCLSIAGSSATWLGFAMAADFMAFITLVYIYRRAPLHGRNTGVFANVMQGQRANYGPLIGGVVMLALWGLTETNRLAGSSLIGPVVALVVFTAFLFNMGVHWRRFVRYLQSVGMSAPER